MRASRTISFWFLTTQRRIDTVEVLLDRRAQEVEHPPDGRTPLRSAASADQYKWSSAMSVERRSDSPIVPTFLDNPENPKPLSWTTNPWSATIPDYQESSEVTMLLDQVPEFGPAYLALVETFDDDPEGPTVFAELADFVSARLIAVETERPVLERTLAAIEEIVSNGGDVCELVGYAFLDSLSPEDRRLIVPWLGSNTRSLLDALDIGLA